VCGGARRAAQPAVDGAVDAQVAGAGVRPQHEGLLHVLGV
jgi:hypothetical protein